MTTDIKPDKASTEQELPRAILSETALPGISEASSKDPEIFNSSEPLDKLSPGLSDLFNRIILTDLIIISVQKDAPDPTKEEKMKYLARLFQEKPIQFLYRYLSCVQPEDPGLFKDHQSDPIVSHYLKRLNQNSNQHKVIRNRRYKKMQELILEGSYFSDDEMRERDEKLHYQMIGQFETEEEREAKVRERMLEEEAKFSSFLLHQSDRQDYLDNNMVEEEEEEEVEDGEDMLQTGSKEELAEQFKHIMMERFLGGQDGDHISYLDIDNNEQYDDLVLRSRDAEDAYFDEESEEECDSTQQIEDDREFNPPPLRPRKRSESPDKS